MIAANHQSFLDIPIMVSVFSCAFIQRPIPYFPGLSWHFGKLSLVIDKDHPLSILKAIKYVKKATFGLGVPVALFPEGTRSVDGVLGEFNLGAATIAKTLNLAVLPVTIYNSRDVFPRGAINSRPGTVLVGLQPMIEEEYIKNHSPEEINREIRQRLQNGLDRLAWEKKGDQPSPGVRVNCKVGGKRPSPRGRGDWLVFG
jgi:1-acyl-sn-glycerol-3-phosphate acyltransferase